jgi:hypothetical protein
VTSLASELRPARLANAGAQETSVILYAHLAAGQKIRHCCNRFCAAARAGTNCQDQIPKRKPSAWSDDLAKLTISFHMLAILFRAGVMPSVIVNMLSMVKVQLFTFYAR